MGSRFGLRLDPREGHGITAKIAAKRSPQASSLVHHPKRWISKSLTLLTAPSRLPHSSKPPLCNRELGDLTHLVRQLASDLVRQPPPELDGLDLFCPATRAPNVHGLRDALALLGCQGSACLWLKLEFVALCITMSASLCPRIRNGWQTLVTASWKCSSETASAVLLVKAKRK